MMIGVLFNSIYFELSIRSWFAVEENIIEGKKSVG
jgi:hypothetical protein